MPNKAECILKRKKELTIQNLYALRSLIKGGGTKAFLFLIFRAPSFFIRHPLISIFKFFPGKKNFLAPIAFFSPSHDPSIGSKAAPLPSKIILLGVDGWEGLWVGLENHLWDKFGYSLAVHAQDCFGVQLVVFKYTM